MCMHFAGYPPVIQGSAKAASCLVKCHRSPLHNLLHFSELLLGKVETITPTLNAVEKSLSLLSEEMWKGRMRHFIDLQLHWVPVYLDFKLNERADDEAKHAAQGVFSDVKFFPNFFCRSLPASVPTLRQAHNSQLLKHWKCRWKSSLWHSVIHHFDYLAPSKKFSCLTQDLSCCQVSLLIQLCTGHIGLNQHLF